MEKDITAKHLDQINETLKSIFIDIVISKGYSQDKVDEYVTEAQGWDCWYFTFKSNCQLELLDLFIKTNDFNLIMERISTSEKDHTKPWY